MNKKILFQAVAKLLLGFLLLCLLIFLPAGTIAFKKGWLFMGALFVPMLVLGIILFFKDTELLKSRLAAKENQADQSAVVKLSGLMFLIGFVVAGLGVRFEFYILPDFVSVAATVVFLIGYMLYAETLRENAYLSRTIEVREGQKVVDSGLYRIVRHPMYSATILMFLAIPLILGSLYAFAVFLFYPLLIAKRIKGEERFLKKELAGYEEYTNRVKYRLIPFVW